MQNAVLPSGLTTLGGTFTFMHGDGYIVIGTVRYGQTDGIESPLPSQTVTPSLPLGSAGPSLSEIRLTLPEEYEIQYRMTETAGLPGYVHEWDFWDLALRKALKDWLPLKHSILYPNA